MDGSQPDTSNTAALGGNRNAHIPGTAPSFRQTRPGSKGRLAEARARIDGLAALFAQTTLFGQLPASARRELAATCHLQQVETGRQIFARGDAGAGMFVVVRGAVAVSVATPDGDEVIFDVLRPPATFGELSVIDNRPRIATATVHQTGALASVPGAAVHRLLRADPGFPLAMMTTLAQLVRQLDDRLADRTLLDLRSRVVKYLVRVAALAEATSGGLVEVDVQVPLSQADLARLVGGSRQQVNRIIVDLERCGAIRRRGSVIVAVAPRAMLRNR